MKLSLERILVGFIFSIIIISLLIFAYNFKSKPVKTLRIPTPGGHYYYLNLTAMDIAKMVSSLKNNFEPNLSREDPYLNNFTTELNRIISQHKNAYIFYYDELQKIYPERYFILCTQYGCGYYYFSVSGLVKASKDEAPINRPLVILIDRETLQSLLTSLKNNDTNVLEKFKKFLIEGKIKIKNFETIAKRISTEYGN